MDQRRSAARAFRQLQDKHRSSSYVRYYHSYYDFDCNGKFDVIDAQLFLNDYTWYIVEEPDQKRLKDEEYCEKYDKWLITRDKNLNHETQQYMEFGLTQTISESENLSSDTGYSSSHPKQSLENAQYVLHYYTQGILGEADLTGWVQRGHELKREVLTFKKWISLLIYSVLI